MRPATAGASRVARSGAARRRSARGDRAPAIAHVPEDRLGTGVAPSLSIALERRAQVATAAAPFSRGPFLRLRRDPRAARRADRSATTSRRRARTTPARQLSGGNLQKVVLAREFSGEPRVLVAASPTRGLDVGAIETVHALPPRGGRATASASC